MHPPGTATTPCDGAWGMSGQSTIECVAGVGAGGPSSVVEARKGGSDALSPIDPEA